LATKEKLKKGNGGVVIRKQKEQGIEVGRKGREGKGPRRGRSLSESWVTKGKNISARTQGETDAVACSIPVKSLAIKEPGKT